MDQTSSELASSPAAAPDPAVVAITRRRLHGIGECLMAGPQRRAGGRFTMRVTPGGFATTGGPALRLDGTDLVVEERRRVAITGTFAEMAETIGVGFGAPPDGYPDGSGVTAGDAVSLDPAAARLIQDWYVLTDAALRVLAPRETPILWPEHFDVAILLDDVSYGASPGDAFHAMPYAYVSAGAHDVSDFWNAPFGAIRSHIRSDKVGDTLWSEWEMRGTRLDGGGHLMRGVLVFSLDGDRARGVRFILEPVDRSGLDADQAVQQLLVPPQP